MYPQATTWRRLMPVAALVVLTAFPSFAFAQTQITHCTEVPLTKSDWQRTLQLPRIDIPGQLLANVFLNVESAIDTAIGAENVVCENGQSVDLETGATFTLSFPSGGVFRDTLVTTKNWDLGPFDKTLDYGGVSGIRSESDKSRNVTMNFLSTGGSLVDFSGNGDLDFVATTAGYTVLSSNGNNLNTEIRTDASVKICATYFFNVILPVQLASFTAEDEGQNDVLLSWSTLSELNNAGFFVEYARGDDDFREIAFVDGHGTTDVEQSYAYQIPALSPGVYQFRLRQVDFDGAEEFSPIVEHEVMVPGQFLLEAAYPNPFTTESTVRFSVRQEQPVTVALYDMLGRQVDVLFNGVPASRRSNEVTIRSDGLPGGVYFVRMVSEDFSSTRKVVLAR
ncbi:MAG: T9SS type A sorting domain-containing protein [Bacteroidota bacterium]